MRTTVVHHRPIGGNDLNTDRIVECSSRISCGECATIPVIRCSFKALGDRPCHRFGQVLHIFACIALEILFPYEREHAYRNECSHKGNGCERKRNARRKGNALLLLCLAGFVVFDVLFDHGALRYPLRQMRSGLLVRFRGIFETITHTMNRMQPLGVTRIVANLSTQVLHMRIDGALVSFEVVAEYLFHKLHT